MDALIALFERMNLWTWWALAGLLLIAELLTGTTYLLWPAAAAFVTGFIAMQMMGIAWPVQLVVFALLSLVLVWAGDRWVRPAFRRGADSGLNDRGGRMIGMRVVASSDFVSGRGRVHVGDTEWAAETSDGSSPTAGTNLEISGVSGVTLAVHEL
tara:strand:- start:42438 stop:42902 length:465 start_codon:yes stop_codon:yes gene_type:complete